MTDQELIARLREGCSCNINSTPCWAETECRDYFAAADRIEAQSAEIERLRGDLAKALQFTKGVIRHAGFWGDDYLAEQARTALAELTVSATVKDYLTTEDEKQSHEWKCPIDYPGCRKNCGSYYGCGN